MADEFPRSLPASTAVQPAKTGWRETVDGRRKVAEPVGDFQEDLMLFRSALLGPIVAFSLIQPAIAQSLFDQFQAEQEETREDRAAQSEALRQFADILNGSDRQHAMDAMEFMIANGDTEIFNYAVEYGVFSADPRMQNAALRAVFDNKKQYRIQYAVLAADDGNEGQFAKYYTGTYDPDAQTGTVTITLGNYDQSDSCWYFDERNSCAFILTGTAVSLRDWQYVTGNLELNEDGQLEGQLTYNNQSRYTAKITLLE